MLLLVMVHLPRSFLRAPCRQPRVVEVSILRLGQVVVLCVPGEFTTMAGRRLRAAVADVLR
jgi:hypothetical protein